MSKLLLPGLMLALLAAVVVGCGGSDTAVLSAPTGTAPGGPPAPPGAPGAPGDPTMEAPSEGASAENPEAVSPDGALPEGTEMPPSEGNPAEALPEGAPGEANPFEGGVNPDGTPIDPSQATVLGRFTNSLVRLAGPLTGAPRMNGEEGGAPGEFSPDGMPAQATPKSLQDRAALAFRRGQDEQAFVWLYSQFLSPRGGDVALQAKMRWSAALRRPVLATRFGIGVIYNAPREWDGNPQAISDRLVPPEEAGDGERPNNRRRRDNPQDASPFAQGAGGDGGGEMLTGAAGRLAHYTGDTGTLLVEQIKSRFAAGELGLAMADVYASKPRQVDPNNPDANFDADLSFSPEGAAPGEEGGDAKAKDKRVGQISPGIMWLGTGEQKDLEQAAAENDLDVLVLYEVTVRPARNANYVNNTTKFRVLTVARRETLFASAQMTNVKVIEERKNGKEKDSLDSEIERAMTALDPKLKVGELPAALMSEHVLARVSALAADPKLDLLPALVEARFYQLKGLLPEKDFLAFAASSMTLERVAPLLVQVQKAKPPMGTWERLEMLEIVHRLAPDLNLEAVQQIPSSALLPQ